MLWLWLGFFALVGVLLLLHRKTSTSTPRDALYWTCVWFVIGLSFAVVVYFMYEHAWLGATLYEPSDSPGRDASTMFASAYLLEYALAFDVVFVISLELELHRVPRRHRGRVLFWGLVGAIVFRVANLSSVAYVTRTFAWTLYVFGALVLYSAIRILASDDEKDLGSGQGMPLTTMLGRFRRLADHDIDGRFFAVRNGRRLLTLGAACVLSIVLVDLWYGLDTAITVVSVSRTTFVLVTANVLATIAVRSMFFLIENVRGFHFSRRAAALLLGVVGMRMLAHEHVHVPHFVVLAVITGIVCLRFAESVLVARRNGR